MGTNSTNYRQPLEIPAKRVVNRGTAISVTYTSVQFGTSEGLLYHICPQSQLSNEYRIELLMFVIRKINFFYGQLRRLISHKPGGIHPE